jgi:putative hydrolase of the HAD superfamily
MEMPLETIHELRRQYFETYGTTLRGLQRHHQVDTDEFLAYVHDLPLEQYISPDALLRETITNLPQEKWIFTNADANHARRVLTAVGLTGCFQGIIDIRALNFICKPAPEAYQQALALAGAKEARECILIDDSLRNLIPAQALGFTTVWLSQNDPNPAVHCTIAAIPNLRQSMPELWLNGKTESLPKRQRKALASAGNRRSDRVK